MKVTDTKKHLEGLALFLLMAVLAVLVFTMGGCAKTGQVAQGPVGSEEEQEAIPKTRTVVDLLGESIEVPTQVDTIAASYAAAEEIFLLLGVQDRNVGVSDDNIENEWLLKFDPGLSDNARIFPGWALDQEALLKASPDVVICHSPEIAAEVRSLAIPAVYAMGTDPDSLIATIELTGEILGGDAEARAKGLAAYYRDNMEQATSRTRALDQDQIKRVYYTTGTDPLNTEGKGSIVTSWIEMAGGRNVAADAGVEGMFIDVDLEDLLAWDPEVVISCDPAATEVFLTDQRFAEMSAVKNNAVRTSPAGAFVWCVRSADEALMTLWATTVIQPDLCSDIKYEDIVRDFYGQFYHYEPTDAEIQGILWPEQ
ncbi:MAG: ABC transporter substrate-binding protein [Coriobacteriales bacterium]|jgi:iron complex transport system substrate-binding protein|nr:ABC transporter substrate-binding protein [Coriobacteriales bacterium]